MNTNKCIREYLSDNSKLLFDGAMGTYYASLYGSSLPCELALLEYPERIKAIHSEYIQSGAVAIKTNTFAANTSAISGGFPLVKTLIEKAWHVANEAAESAQNDVFVFADIGVISGEDSQDEYRKISDLFLSLGAENFIFETLSDLSDAVLTAEYIKSVKSNAYIIVSVAAQPDGFTRSGDSVFSLLSELDRNPNVDASGLNCISGPTHLLKITEQLPTLLKPLAVMPNSGYPSVVGGRTYYPDGAGYFAEQTVRIARRADIIGGCCGTTPEYIRAVSQILPGIKNEAKVHYQQVATEPISGTGRFLEKLKAGKRVIAVELDPPSDPKISGFMSGAKFLAEKEVDAITIADCPVARVRADSSMLAAKLKRELGIDTIPHMTCRDRNINATKALLLGLGIEEVENVLVVTGDPIPSANRDEIKAVFSFNSAVLAKYIKQLGQQTGKTFAVGGALNVNAPNFTAELKKAQRKEAAGVDFFLTQPIFTEKAKENLSLAHKALNSFVLGGIIPIVSYRNAKFMQTEMAGIDIPDEIAEKYRDLDREKAEVLAVDISFQIAKEIRDICDGYYLITPFARVGIIGKIIDEIRGMEENL